MPQWVDPSLAAPDDFCCAGKVTAWQKLSGSAKLGWTPEGIW